LIAKYPIVPFDKKKFVEEEEKEKGERYKGKKKGE
jgi:hypothetical protein